MQFFLHYISSGPRNIHKNNKNKTIKKSPNIIHNPYFSSEWFTSPSSPAESIIPPFTLFSAMALVHELTIHLEDPEREGTSEQETGGREPPEQELKTFPFPQALC